MQRRLEDFSQRGYNFDPAAIRSGSGFVKTDVRYPLAVESPGEPAADGSWQIARELIADYAFADPRIVRAFYDTEAPLQGRTMVLELRALGVFRVHVGVRILQVEDETREVDGRHARVWGWTYGTLRGHVESGEMSWEVWKWLDSGAVEFHARATSRTARILNPFTRVGFAVLEPHERKLFLRHSGERMQRLVQAELGSR